MQPQLSGEKKTSEETVAYQKMVDENDNNEEEAKKGLFSSLITKKVDTCCLNPKNCCVVQNPISQKVIEVVKNRFK